MEIVSQFNHSRHPVPDESYVGTVRRLAKDLSFEIDFSEGKREKVNLVVSELATNLAKHAQKGEILLRAFNFLGSSGLEIISVDHGPGIDDLDLVQVDGYTESDTLGGGLGSIRRLADSFEISSKPDSGTVVRAMLLSDSKQVPDKDIEIGALSVPIGKEPDSGDGIGIARNKDYLSILVVDALGHGPLAAQARQIAFDTFQKNPFDSPLAIVEQQHIDLEGSRGIAVAMSRIDLATNKLEFVGVGNITGRSYEGHSSKNFCSRFGVVGGRLSKLKAEEHQLGRNFTLLYFSDGIGSSAKIDKLNSLPASMIAGSIFRDHVRTTDDATVLVVKDMRF